MSVKKKIETEKTEEVKFTKEQILKSKNYRDKRDLINALLVNGRSYALSEVDKQIEKFMEEGV